MGAPKGRVKPAGSGGSRKGVPNKSTAIAKDVIAQAAEGLGGADRLLSWAKEAPENERAFWATIYPKLLPLTVGGSVGVHLNWPLNKPKLEN